MVEKLIRESISVAVFVQAFIVAVITAGVSGYVSARVLEGTVSYLAREIARIDTEAKETRQRVDEISHRQARAISQADTIHDGQNKRMDRLESSRR